MSVISKLRVCVSWPQLQPHNIYANKTLRFSNSTVTFTYEHVKQIGINPTIYAANLHTHDN